MVRFVTDLLFRSVGDLDSRDGHNDILSFAHNKLQLPEKGRRKNCNGEGKL